MANYTMTISDCLNSPLTPLFNFDYPFYVDDERLKQAFEEKFILYYLNCEIGFETFPRFEKALQSRLTIKMDYYKQLYQTQLEAKNINFLLNKDLRETFIREVESENVSSGKNTTLQNTSNENSMSQTGSSTTTTNLSQTGTSSTTNETSQEGTSTTTHKESSMNDGVAQASLTNGYLTGTSSDDGSNSSTTSISSTDENETTGTSSVTDENETSGTTSQTGSIESSGTSSQTGNEKVTERTDLFSQGNIGITSSATLLQKWREVLINIDEIIIEDCRDLFMRIY